MSLVHQPSCDEELQVAWQTLKTGSRSLEAAYLGISAMKITAQRAADKVEQQNDLVKKAGSKTTIANFRAGRYLRRTRSLLKKVEKTMRMLVREEPHLLQAICVEKKRIMRLAKRAQRPTQSTSKA
jgi:hypothetical protein